SCGLDRRRNRGPHGSLRHHHFTVLPRGAGIVGSRTHLRYGIRVLRDFPPQPGFLRGRPDMGPATRTRTHGARARSHPPALCFMESDRKSLVLPAYAVLPPVLAFLCLCALEGEIHEFLGMARTGRIRSQRASADGADPEQLRRSALARRIQRLTLLPCGIHDRHVARDLVPATRPKPRPGGRYTIVFPGEPVYTQRYGSLVSRVIDIHCHILPEVDDGPKSWEVSAEMCRMAASDGITHVVATPHCNDRYHYDHEYLTGCLKQLQEM